MTIGVVTSFTHNDTEYDVPTTKSQRKRFTNELITELEAIDGVDDVFNAGTTQTWDSIRLEITLDTAAQDGRERLVPDPRSISPRIRNTFTDFVPVSRHEILYTPEPVDASEDLYEDNLYIAEAWFY